ncbi:MAG: DNA polymerase III subunit chi [Legionellaceae bacterium]|nr:DNA polymerase III subunit chi [Legionellaceae bacterium]
MRVDFYLLTNEEPQANWLVACRLLEKAYQRGHRVFVFCEHASDASLIDELLWTYKDNSFIPHNLQGEGPEPPPAVQIGYDQEPRGYNDILLNMSSAIPAFHTRFRRIIEIVQANEDAKEISRNHFREYRKHGYELTTHTIETSTQGE